MALKNNVEGNKKVNGKIAFDFSGCKEIKTRYKETNPKKTKKL
jgi:hypothetical protein